MMNDFLRTPVWYPVLGAYSLMTNFLKLTPEELEALKNGEESGAVAQKAINRLKPLMKMVPHSAFVSVDVCAPVDTERYTAKRGAVYSAQSAWRFLARSQKVRQAVVAGHVTSICVRPFRSMNIPREFRLFIKDRKLAAASQYHLIRHFRRLEGVKKDYWKRLDKFVKEISELLEIPTLVMDVYVTTKHEVLIIDLNEFGGKTDPLMLRKWEQDWENISEPKLKLMPPPFKISGEVTVSF